jgi:hypothetical protein
VSVITITIIAWLFCICCGVRRGIKVGDFLARGRGGGGGRWWFKGTVSRDGG